MGKGAEGSQAAGATMSLYSCRDTTLCTHRHNTHPLALRNMEQEHLLSPPMGVQGLGLIQAGPGRDWAGSGSLPSPGEWFLPVQGG